jgi:hypothetical protein
VIVRPAFTASSRQRSTRRSSAGALGSSFFKGCRFSPGTIPAASQLASLISTTTTSVVF